jgi:hypothetical protein
VAISGAIFNSNPEPDPKANPESNSDHSQLGLATVPSLDRLYYSGSITTRPQAVWSRFVQNVSFN